MPSLALGNRTPQSFSALSFLSLVWILSSGFWQDNNTWIDGATWTEPTLSFTAFTALPTERRTAVATAVGIAAAKLSVIPQSIVDALGRCLEWWDWKSNTFTDAASTVLAVQGDAIQAFRGVRAGLLATQATAGLRPTLGATGIVSVADRLVAPATGFPTGNSNFGYAGIVDYAATQPTTFPSPFSRCVGNDNTRLLSYSTLAAVGLGNYPIGSPNGVDYSSFVFYNSSAATITSRFKENAEVVAASTAVPNFSGSVFIGSAFAIVDGDCTIRQVAWVNNLADARLIFEFLKRLERIV